MSSFNSFLIVFLICITIGCATTNAASFNAEYQLSLVNKVRAQNGKSPLVLSPCLLLSAQAQSNYQLSIITMTHNSPYGSLFDRMIKFGCQLMTSVAENVAMGQQTDDTVMNAWVASPGHFANIIGNYKYFGAGMAQSSSNGAPFWTQQFANYQTCVPTSSSSSSSTTVKPTTSSVSSANSGTSSTSLSTSSNPTSGTSSTSSSSGSTSGTPTGPNLSNTTLHVSLVNTFRVANNKPVFILCPCLVQAALAHSQYQASINTATNSDPEGSVANRIRARGCPNVSTATQNIGCGFNTDASAVQGFTTTSTKNNLLGNYQYFGSAMVKSPQGYPYWTQIVMNGECS
ncbi:hypothetical protein DFA_08354 [Cavenderia fasciculata]|uniref:SCP domain-containing protein n=1 Tax=Cavenderia fasciculata TaxID=261658 RepID=F4Q5V0_CACFS|nr:uncharacterized protein DFA_08354 [Cavenderia fasciculata]EGG17359.1 hypothetical protein DFA_08354 [Cavenderia fasciculata]|eukprot:XP_004355843.1 hypothetical protein DFA_08354 [Cavenderia fasciculata]